MKYVNLTPKNVARIVYKGIRNGEISDARVEANSRTVYVKKSNELTHEKSFGVLSNNDLLRAIWVECGNSSQREIMESISGPNSPEWSIKYLVASKCAKNTQ